MGRAEFAPADEFYAGKQPAQLLLENGKNLVAEEQKVPQLRDGLPIERVEPLGQRALRLLSFPTGPNDFIEAIAAGLLGHDKLLPTMALLSELRFPKIAHPHPAINA